MKKKTFIVMVFLICFNSFISADAPKTPEPVEWQSPLPKVSDLKLDLKLIESIIGEGGHFIFRRNLRTVTTWTAKGEETYPDACVVSAMRIVHAPIEKARNAIIDYSLLNEIQSQHQDVKPVTQKDNHTLYSFVQVYNLSVLTLKADFLVQQTIEEDGSISILLHEGDVDAQVVRWEFFPIDENKTMVSITFWSAWRTARLAFKVFISLIQESRIAFPTVYCSMYLEQFARYMEKDWITEREKLKNNQLSDNKLEIPIYNKKLSPKGRELIEWLVNNEGQVIIRTCETINFQGKNTDVKYVSAFDKFDIPLDDAVPLLTNPDNLPDFVSYVKKIVRKKLPQGERTYYKCRLGKFPFLWPFFVEEDHSEIEDNSLTFRNIDGKGEFFPYAGAYEWRKMSDNKDETLFTVTKTCKIGPECNFIIRKLLQSMPEGECFALIGENTMSVEERKKWFANKNNWEKYQE